jgi:prepilin-type N-terminal cleavage/methylation domain-containing protein
MEQGTSCSRPLHGFTLAELLVVIAIIGVLIALLLPAVQAVRASARRTQCAHHMRQAALGLLTYEQQLRHFPPGTYNYIDDSTASPLPAYSNSMNRRGWMHDLLPFIEEAGLYDRFVMFMASGTAMYGAVDFPDRGSIVRTLMCPDDPLGPKVKTFDGPGWAPQGFSGNLVVCAGGTSFNPGGALGSARLDGMFFAGSRVKAADVRDGMSKTALVSELILMADTTGHDTRGRYYNPSHGGVMFSAIYPPNTPVPDRVAWCVDNPLPPAPVFWPPWGSDIYSLARSYHQGGVQMAAADASVRFVSNTIAPDVFKALSTRKGDEQVGAWD